MKYRGGYPRFFKLCYVSQTDVASHVVKGGNLFLFTPRKGRAVLFQLQGGQDRSKINVMAGKTCRNGRTQIWEDDPPIQWNWWERRLDNKREWTATNAFNTRTAFVQNECTMKVLVAPQMHRYINSISWCCFPALPILTLPHRKKIQQLIDVLFSTLGRAASYSWTIESSGEGPRSLKASRKTTSASKIHGPHLFSKNWNQMLDMCWHGPSL